jgi:hypothetical protein
MTSIADLLDHVRFVRATQATGDMAAVMSCGPLMRPKVLASLARRTRPVSRSAVVTSGNMVRQCAHADRGEVLNVIWQHGPSRAAWSTALLLGWLGGSAMVVTAAGTRARLRRWFDAARLWEPLPFLVPHVVARDEMPETVEIFRGGLVDAAEPLVGGYSWTGRVDVAAMYGALRALEYGAPPTIIRGEVPRALVKLRSRTSDDEVVLTEPVHGAAVHLDDAQEIERLARAEAACRSSPGDQDVLHLVRHDDRTWNGWQAWPGG